MVRHRRECLLRRGNLELEAFLRKLLPDGKFVNVPDRHSKTMASVRATNNRTTELRFRLALVRAGVRGWQMHCSALTGNPDFYFPESRVAVFVDGCFWHGCPRCGHTPKTNSQFWREKILRNRRRDRRTNQVLRRNQIRVLRFWEHTLSNSLDLCIQKILRELQ